MMAHSSSQHSNLGPVVQGSGDLRRSKAIGSDRLCQPSIGNVTAFRRGLAIQFVPVWPYDCREYLHSLPLFMARPWRPDAPLSLVLIALIAWTNSHAESTLPSWHPRHNAFSGDRRRQSHTPQVTLRSLGHPITAPPHTTQPSLSMIVTWFSRLKYIE